MQYNKTPAIFFSHKVNRFRTINIWFKMVFRSCFYCIILVEPGWNSCFCIKYPQLWLPFRKNVFGSTFWFIRFEQIRPWWNMWGMDATLTLVVCLLYSLFSHCLKGYQNRQYLLLFPKPCLGLKVGIICVLNISHK